jgi:TonB family protein
VKAILFILISLLAVIEPCKSQTQAFNDTVYYTNSDKKTTRDKSTYYKIITQHHKLFLIREYYLTDTPKMVGTCSFLNPISREGKWIYYYENGTIKSTCEYVSNKLEGAYKYYYPSGRLDYTGTYSLGKETEDFLYYYDEDGNKLRRKEHYHAGEFEEGFCYTHEGKDTTFFPYEEMPEFPGGESAMIRFLTSNIQYPPDAREKKITGRVVLKFVVTVRGTIDSIEILKSVYPSIDKEAMRVIKEMPPWTPGKHEGQPVSVWYTFPIAFKLE